MLWFSRASTANSPTTASARWVFLRALGLIYLIAFVSLKSQILGLVGSQGILPAYEFLEAARQQLGPERYWVLPTLCWVCSSDGALGGFCLFGVVCAVVLILDLAPALALIFLWITYLSLVTICRDFLSFQWDNLLLETGFLAIFFAPLRLWWGRNRDAPPSRMVVWLLRWLLFRLVYSSGTVKLASGDPTWRSLTALSYHYETQPLPTWIAWYAHHLPMWAQRGSCLVMFLIELVVPFLIFGPPVVRYMACVVLVGFQLLIALTGNYCFFNLLTIALCLLLLDDRLWSVRVEQSEIATTSRRWPRWIIGPIAAVILTVSTMEMAALVGVRGSWLRPAIALHRLVQPFRTINGYGLFAVMTTTRPEILIEGSPDGREWLPYTFQYKPGDVRRRPRFVAPHQPRLDWQMWFAALGSYRENPWFLALCARLLQGSPDVIALLASNPFPTTPPRYVRATVYEYHFSSQAARRAEGVWWTREAKGLYCPVLSRRQNF